KKLINRRELSTFHGDLSAYLEANGLPGVSAQPKEDPLEEAERLAVNGCAQAEIDQVRAVFTKIKKDKKKLAGDLKKAEKARKEADDALAAAKAQAFDVLEEAERQAREAAEEAQRAIDEAWEEMREREEAVRRREEAVGIAEERRREAERVRVARRPARAYVAPRPLEIEDDGPEL
ncbi:hypothetical protein, partial [Xiamenia xianingshaonis]|uniref:hypothetical protein n=1 Tax=Xiamenia xianingshaonis TaxID=2682776 RepID=UPI0021BDC286